MPWISTIAPESSSGLLNYAYDRVRERAGTIPNIARLQSLRPAAMLRGFDLYCRIMDEPGGISKRERVLVATVVSKINGCLY